MPTISYGAGLNAGFVQGIWYATSTNFSDMPTRIYIALRNNTESDLTGTIRFTDNGAKIGNSYVSALPGRLVEGWVDWTPTFGTHTITASLIDMKLHVIGGSAENVTPDNMLAEDTLTIDYDTDRDGIGNAIDTDDDNDSITDSDEIKNGTNPLIPTLTEKIETSHNSNTATINNAMTSVGSEKKNTPTARPSSNQGLEQYIDQAPFDTLLSNVTEKVTTAKENLDTYRENRADELHTYFTLSKGAATRTAENLISIPTSSMSELATITRSRIEKTHTNFFDALLNGVKALVSGLYTFTLWLLSSILAHPAILELGLLIGILYIFYRVARRLGSRPRR